MESRLGKVEEVGLYQFLYVWSGRSERQKLVLAIVASNLSHLHS